MKFQTKLKHTRKKLKLTQQEFAEKAGFSRSTISELESGTKKPSLKTIEKLCAATNTETTFWLDQMQSHTNTVVSIFNEIALVIDYLIDIGMIDENGVISESAKELLMKMLEKEIKSYVNNRNNK